MKFWKLPIFILCIYWSQLCSSRVVMFDQDIIKNVEIIRNSIYGVSELFMDDVKVIFGRIRNDSMVFDHIFNGLVDIGDVPKVVMNRRNVTIDARMMKYIHYEIYSNALSTKFKMDTLKIIQSILSKQLPSERYQGIMNLLYMYFYTEATTEEIESALGYLYGTDAAATKTSFLNKIPDMKSTDFPRQRDNYALSKAEYVLTTMTEIKPKVIQDFMAIYDKFPCTHYVLEFLLIFSNELKRSQGSDSKVDACLVKEHQGIWDIYWPVYNNTKDRLEREFQELESVLSTRLTDESHGGLITFLRATFPDTPIDEIEKALEYLYDDVPKAKCPEKEGARSETE